MFKNRVFKTVKTLALGFSLFCLPAAASATNLAAVTGDAAEPATSAALKHIVAKIYEPYLGPDSDSEPEPPAFGDAIKPFASPELASALLAQQQCESKTQDECGPDFDVVVDGQDWGIAAAPAFVSVVVSPAEIDVIARFVSLDTPISIGYVFKKTADAWRLDDIRGRSAGGKPDIWSLAGMLAGVPR